MTAGMSTSIEDHRAKTARQALDAGLTLSGEAIAGIAQLQQEGGRGHAALMARLSDGTLAPADYVEACSLARRDLVSRMAEHAPVDDLTRMLGSEAVPVEAPPEREGWPYWLRFALPRASQERSRANVEFIEALTALCRMQAFEEVDRGYRLVEPGEVSEVGLISLLRSVFMWRDRLEEWEPLRERARSHFLSAGRDADKLLMGLGGPSGPSPRP